MGQGLTAPEQHPWYLQWVDFRTETLRVRAKCVPSGLASLKGRRPTENGSRMRNVTGYNTELLLGRARLIQLPEPFSPLVDATWVHLRSHA